MKLSIQWTIWLLLVSPSVCYKKHRRKKIKVEYEYLPQDYKDKQDPKIFSRPTQEGGGGGGSSVWGYLTAAVVAANVAVNLGNFHFMINY